LESSITHALLIAYFKKLKYLLAIVTFCTMVVNIFTGKRCNDIHFQIFTRMDPTEISPLKVLGNEKGVGATVRRWFQTMAMIVFGAPRLFSYQLPIN
jgi:hypothetical protein